MEGVKRRFSTFCVQVTHFFDRCDWPPEGGCEGLEEPQWAQDEDEGDNGVVEEAKVIMDV